MRFIKNLLWAIAGIRSFFRTEQNGRIQGVIALLVIAAAGILQLSKTEWLFILGCIGMVLCLEMINSSIEKLCNLISTEYNPAIKTIKDISAAAVLLASIIAAIIGAIIFLPHILHSL